MDGQMDRQMCVWMVRCLSALQCVPLRQQWVSYREWAAVGQQHWALNPVGKILARRGDPGGQRARGETVFSSLGF